MTRVRASKKNRKKGAHGAPDAALSGNEDAAIEESETAARPVKMAFYLANAVTSRRALRKTYMLPDIFRYSITATRGTARGELAAKT